MPRKFKSVPVQVNKTLKRTALRQAGSGWKKQDFFGHGKTQVCHSATDAAKAYGLDWQVCLTHVRSVTTGLSAPSKNDHTSRDPRFDQIKFTDNRGVIRMDTLAPMGTVGTAYHTIQNVDAMAIFDELAKDRKLELFSGGWFLEGPFARKHHGIERQSADQFLLQSAYPGRGWHLGGGPCGDRETWRCRIER